MSKRREGREQRGTEKRKACTRMVYFQQKAGDVMTFMMSHFVM